MNITITTSDGTVYIYKNVDLRLFEYSQYDNGVYFEINLPDGRYNSHAFIFVIDVKITK